MVRRRIAGLLALALLAVISLKSAVAQSVAPQFWPWKKFCSIERGKDVGRVCQTAEVWAAEPDGLLVSVILAEWEDEVKKTLRVTVSPPPFEAQFPQDFRAFIDVGERLTSSFAILFPNFCLLDFKASDELISQMKVGKVLTLQFIGKEGQTVTSVIPLADFAKAYDGPLADPKEQLLMPVLWF